MTISDLFSALTDVVEGAYSVLSMIFSDIGLLFWNTNTTEGGTLTFLGVVVLTVVGAPLAFSGVQYLISLVNKIKVKK